MTEVHINIPDYIIGNISNYYNNNLPSLIHLYSHGVCITQNINNNSNISLYLNKDQMSNYKINKEVAFYFNENINKLQEIKIISNDNSNYIYIDDQISKIQFIHSCNFCKNIQEIQFIETKIPKDILDKIDFGWMKENILLFKGDSLILLSDQVNGLIIKINENDFTVFVNSLA